MQANILCIDDGPKDEIEAIANTLTFDEGVNINVEVMCPQGVERDVAVIEERLKETSDFALLVDLRLDQDAPANQQRVSYRGPTLVQELRSRMVGPQPALKPFPIVLWSADERLHLDYEADITSHDLFDFVVSKDALRQDFGEVSRKICGLVSGYAKLLNTGRSLKEMLAAFGLDEESSSWMPEEALNEVVDTITRSVPSAAKFINDELLDFEGSLISTEILAVRLGVDLSALDEKETDILMTAFGSALYRGPFCDSRNLWWWAGVEALWHEHDQRNLRRLNADERIVSLAQWLQVTFPVAKKIDHKVHSSHKFFTVCCRSGEPLDPKEGLRFKKNCKYSWQIQPLVSMKEGVNLGASAQDYIIPDDIEFLQDTLETIVS